MVIVPGVTLQDRYQITEQFQQGGMGTVFKAKDLRLKRIVAVKECKFTEKKLRKQFEQEAQLLGFLRHPALPIVSDHFGVDDQLFLVMDYVDGDDLGEVLQTRGEPFSLDAVLKWADQLLDVLIYIHEQTPPIIHRDIKPKNLKLSNNSQVILLDFGLAKGLPTDVKITTSGSVFGYTPNYAPLEQQQGTGTDARSDLYSLSATLYHLLSGSIPSDGLTRADAIINGNPDPLIPLQSSGVPLAVSQVIHRGLSLRREARPASAREMRRLLTEAGNEVRNRSVGISGDLVTTVSTNGSEVAPEVVRDLGDETLVQVGRPAIGPVPFRRTSNLANVKRSPPAQLDHAFYGGLAMGIASSFILITSTMLGFGFIGVTVWLLSLSLTGILTTVAYLFRSPIPLKPAEALRMGILGGLISAVVQWLLLILAYFISANYYAGILPTGFGSEDALLLLICLLVVLGCISPVGAVITARYIQRSHYRHKPSSRSEIQ